MAEQAKCPKCGGLNVKAHANHRGVKIGKCGNPKCGFFGALGKATEEETEEARKRHRQKKQGPGTAKSKATPAAGGRTTAGRAEPTGAGHRQPKQLKPYEPPKQPGFFDWLAGFLE